MNTTATTRRHDRIGNVLGALLVTAIVGLAYVGLAMVVAW